MNKITLGPRLTQSWGRTIVDPVTEVALPPALIQEGNKWIDVCATGATAHYRVGRDHR